MCGQTLFWLYMHVMWPASLRCMAPSYTCNAETMTRLKANEARRSWEQQETHKKKNKEEDEGEKKKKKKQQKNKKKTRKETCKSRTKGRRRVREEETKKQSRHINHNIACGEPT